MQKSTPDRLKQKMKEYKYRITSAHGINNHLSKSNTPLDDVLKMKKSTEWI